MKVQPIKDDGEWVRDADTGVILNINKEEIKAARERKKLKLQQAKEEKNLKDKVDKLEQDMGDIKNLLSQIAERL